MMDGAFAGKLPWGSFLLYPGRNARSFGSPWGLLGWEILWMPGDMGIDEEDE